MALQSYSVYITATTTIIAKGIAGQKTRFLITNTAANPVYVGDANVNPAGTTNNGFYLGTVSSGVNMRLDITLNAEDVLYAACGTGLTSNLAIVATAA